MIEIDGSFGEGGGQILRTSLTLAALTAKPLRIFNIRANREKPGLQNQHLTACLAASQVCQGVLEGASLGSTELQFQPGVVKSGEYSFDVTTAGSVILVAQTLLPILLHAPQPSTVRISGGTHVAQTPGYDYFKHVFLPAINRFGARIKATLLQAGYYPKGLGCIELKIKPTTLRGQENWSEKGNPCALVRLTGLPSHIAEREVRILSQQGFIEPIVFKEEGESVGNAVTVWRSFIGAWALGERGKPAEDVVAEAIQQWRGESGEVDRHLADQLLLYAALSQGTSRYVTSHVTTHLQTNAHVIDKFIERDIHCADNEIVIL